MFSYCNHAKMQCSLILLHAISLLNVWPLRLYLLSTVMTNISILFLIK